MGGNGGDVHNFTIEAQSRFNTPKECERIGRWFAIKRYVFKKNKKKSPAVNPMLATKMGR